MGLSIFKCFLGATNLWHDRWWLRPAGCKFDRLRPNGTHDD